ncbi:hypothetical protein BBI09_14500 [Stutzerimonas xanthomarina]|nr:hypothetical protein BBI09_14500 [Stutzerimonas xanthomarina]
MRQARLVELLPRNVLKRVLGLYAEQGWKPAVAPEMELYLTKHSLDPDLPIEVPEERSGRAESGRQSFSIEATNEVGALFDDVYSWCEIQGLSLDTPVHEGGPAQMEINFHHGDALSLADQISVFKRTMRQAAFRHDVSVTCMVKPISRHGGAPHIHRLISTFEIHAAQTAWRYSLFSISIRCSVTTVLS